MVNPLDFEWDEDKCQSNLKKHGVDFADACQIFQGYILEVADTRSHYGEERFLAFGLFGDQVLAVVYTLRGEAIRLISARKASKDEREAYYQSYFGAVRQFEGFN